jgi:hypothetical protein
MSDLCKARDQYADALRLLERALQIFKVPWSQTTPNTNVFRKNFEFWRDKFGERVDFLVHFTISDSIDIGDRVAQFCSVLEGIHPLCKLRQRLKSCWHNACVIFKVQ